MKRLILVLLVTYAGCFGLINLARVFGAAAGLPRGMHWFTYADGRLCEQMCLLGITRHDLYEDAVRAALAAHPLTQSLPLRRLDGGYRLVSRDIVMEIPIDEATGEVIRFSVFFFEDASTPLLGEIVAHCASPDVVSTSGQSFLVYTDELVQLELFDYPVRTPYQRVAVFTFLNPKYHSDLDFQNSYKVWRGFHTRIF